MSSAEPSDLPVGTEEGEERVKGEGRVRKYCHLCGLRDHSALTQTE
jgi:hypothetical protein